MTEVSKVNDRWTAYQPALEAADSLQAAKLSSIQAKTVTGMSDSIRSSGISF